MIGHVIYLMAWAKYFSVETKTSATRKKAIDKYNKYLLK